MLTQVLALKLAPYNINVNAVCPSYTDTEIMQMAFQKKGPIEDMNSKQYKKTII